jgi:hypothetical protein
MDIKRLTGIAKGAADKAKEAFDERGGVQGLKDNLSHVKDAASKPGSLKEKAAAAKDALAHEPEGEAAAEATPEATQPSATEATPTAPAPAEPASGEAASGEPAAPAGA